MLSGGDGYGLSHEDGFMSDAFDDELEQSSELEREWRTRHDQLHPVS